MLKAILFCGLIFFGVKAGTEILFDVFFGGKKK